MARWGFSVRVADVGWHGAWGWSKKNHPWRGRCQPVFQVPVGLPSLGRGRHNSNNKVCLQKKSCVCVCLLLNEIFSCKERFFSCWLKWSWFCFPPKSRPQSWEQDKNSEQRTAWWERRRRVTWLSVCRLLQGKRQSSDSSGRQRDRSSMQPEWLLQSCFQDHTLNNNTATSDTLLLSACSTCHHFVI